MFQYLLIFLFATTLSGAVVFDQSDLGSNGNEMTQWQQAENFRLGQNATIRGVRFWSLEFRDSYQGSMSYAFYTDNLGAPGNLLASGSTAKVYRTQVPTQLSGYNTFLNDFAITPFDATGSVTYWLVLHNGPLSHTERSDFYWLLSTSGLQPSGRELIAPFDANWRSNGYEHAFQLSTTGVPEPGTAALLASGLLLAGVARLRRR